MSQASDLLRRGQRFHAEQFPATVSINGQSYACATSGLQRQRDLITGGWLDKYQVSFWLPLQAFTDAGQPVPAPHGYPVIWQAVEYAIAAAPIDAAAATIVLRCESPDQ